MSDIESLVSDVTEACSGEDVSLGEVRQIIEKAVDGSIDDVSFEEASDSDVSYDELVARLGVVVDMELGNLQKEWADNVVDAGGFVVEDEDGVVYGFDEEGSEL